MKDKELILKVLVGSQAHGLAGPDSDYDYRGVYVVPTKDILSLNHKYKGSHWLEGKEDQTSYEVAHFLQLATKCNPTILEVFKAPLGDNHYDKAIYTEEHPDELFNVSKELRELFPYVWNPHDAFNAFTGYGCNQRKKMLENKDNRASKYATAWLRTLWNLRSLLQTGDFSLEVKDEEFKAELLEVRKGDWTYGEIVDKAVVLEMECEAHKKLCTHEPDIEKVNEFLLKVRKEFWE